MAPSTPPPPSRVVFAAFTIASTSSLVISPRRMSTLRECSGRVFPEAIFNSRRESIDLPGAVRPSGITKSVVQTIGAALPEFEQIGFDQVTSPERRYRHRAIGGTVSHHGQDR